MKKRYGCLILAACLLMGSVLTAQAKDGWKAEFTGKAIESNFSSQSIADEVSGLLPGDSTEIKVSIVNSSDRSTDWYMSNEVRRSLEDNSPAKGGAYEYVLTYHGSGDPVVLYSSDQVGGEVVGKAGEGLHEATDNLEEFFYLDSLGKGKQAYITLRVSLNGETQGNNYQNTLAELRLRFAVEEAPDGGSNGSTGSNRTPGSSAVYNVGAVQTGDTSNILLWSVLLLISGMGLAVTALICQKRSRGGQEND